MVPVGSAGGWEMVIVCFLGLRKRREANGFDLALLSCSCISFPVIATRNRQDYYISSRKSLRVVVIH